ncbi:uncharacterized protein B4U79_14013 [Dinothrombium tinctorium]|uniref:FHA domain-containing protein n=1 Tax=Dinothrombium tinctorium TaxID=1965070 RepID=A0A3S3PBQ1_9ACAR|nr:uncharacterized protein B4U79_01924 [Dinothrombium tinctorium]RWS10308.1 uncharacterized protein B4U79_07680 [Dinothrombium tinctorium]RWS16161.1 uncharacterized protein B4U79_14013 [Dinothrombium tinctorium]
MVWIIEGSRCDGNQPFRHELTTQKEIIIGRSQASSIHLKSATVSRQHCKLVKVNDKWYIEDLKTKNGTDVNGSRLEPQCRKELFSGAIIKIAPTLEAERSFCFTIKNESDDESLSPNHVVGEAEKVSQSQAVVEDVEILLSDDESCDENHNKDKSRNEAKYKNSDDRRRISNVLNGDLAGDSEKGRNDESSENDHEKMDLDGCNYSQDDVIILDSDNEDFFFSSSKRNSEKDEDEPKVKIEREISDLGCKLTDEDLNDGNELNVKWNDDMEYDQKLAEDILMSDDSADELCRNISDSDLKQKPIKLVEEIDSKPSTSGTQSKAIKKRRYNLSSSSSSSSSSTSDDEDSPTEPNNAARAAKLNNLNFDDNKFKKPLNLLKEIKRPSKPLDSVRKKLSAPSSSRQTLFINPMKAQVPRKNTIFQPISVKPTKPISLREQLRQNYRIHGSSCNIPSKPTKTEAFKKPSTNDELKKQKLKLVAERQASEMKKREEATKRSSPVKKTKPSVPQPTHTSRGSFLLTETKETNYIATKPEQPEKAALWPLRPQQKTEKSKDNNNVKRIGTEKTTNNANLGEKFSKTQENINPCLQQLTGEYLQQARKQKFKHYDYNMDDFLAAKRKKREDEKEKKQETSTSSKPENKLSKTNTEQLKVSIPLKELSESKPGCTEQSKAKERTEPKQTPHIVESSAHLQNDYVPISKSTTGSKLESADSVLSQVLSWKHNWISESLNQTKPPPVSALPLRRLKNYYENSEDYIKHFTPLILYEMWDNLASEASIGNKESQIVKMAIVACENSNDHFTNLGCQVAVRKNQSKPEEGDLVLLDLPFWNKDTSAKAMMYGYISYVECEPITSKTQVVDYYKVPEGCQELCKYEIKIKRKSLAINQQSLIRVRSLLYIKPMLRNAEALMSIKQSPLCDDILKPRKMTCQIITPTSIKLESSEHNESQHKAIIGSAEAIMRPFSVPKLLMIQGPPGTGKTHTLVGMIKHIFIEYAKSPQLPKLLVCAPSNNAIDEIARRLYRERKFLMQYKQRDLRLVRIGQGDSISPDVKIISLESHVETNIRSSIAERKRQFESKERKLEEKVAQLDQEIANCRALGLVDKMKACERDLHRVSTELKAHQGEGKVIESTQYKDRNRTRYELLRKSDIVLSTLNSCRQTILEQVFNSPNSTNFNCVIVDEASQCTEPEILMPLTYAVSKLILIGDPMQLPPTVKSKIAVENKYNRSLFERFYSFFGETNPNSPVLMLDTQYRMHPEICSFPSKHFYNNKLKSHSSLQDRRFPLRPYVVFDLKGTLHTQNNPKNIYNDSEAQFITRLIMAIGDYASENTTVGIITPYNGQKRLLEQKIKSVRPKISPIINTIDSFQGQEKDIIILSCVRADEGNGSIGFLNSRQRVNVALTRAKHALIICVCAQTLSNNDLWKSLLDDAKERKLMISLDSTVGIEHIKNHIKLPPRKD